MRALLAAALTGLAVSAADLRDVLDKRVKHIILLQFENRAFDHMLGYMKTLNPDINGIDGTEYNFVNPGVNDTRIYTDDHAEYVDPDPFHSYEAIAQQMFGSDANSTLGRTPTMSGFVANGIANLGEEDGLKVMSCFDPTTLPVLTTLASNFALLDNYFAEPLPTFPNRLFTMSATSFGVGENSKFWTIVGFPQTSIFQAIDEAGLEWRNYMEAGASSWLFSYTRNATFFKQQRYRFMDSFFQDVAKGDLPAFSWIDPLYFDFGTNKASDQHASHDVADGERFLKSVYEAVRASPVWNETALIVTYDEHGGFFDHVPPPVTGVPNPDGHACGDCGLPFNFDHLGVRVPTVIISPWVAKGQVVHKPDPDHMPTPNSQFEHASISATLHSHFGTPLLNKRDAWAAPLDYIWEESPLSQPRTDCPTTLPNPPETTAAFASHPRDGNNELHDLQEGMLTLAHGFFGSAKSVAEADAKNAAMGITTEAKAGEFVRTMSELAVKGGHFRGQRIE